jgi:hypothetical protein
VLAEIFFLRLEATARATKEATSSNPRFDDPRRFEGKIGSALQLTDETMLDQS